VKDKYKRVSETIIKTLATYYYKAIKKDINKNDGESGKKWTQNGHLNDGDF